MTTGTNPSIATHGEELACRHLLLQGYEILERNWRFGRRGELDIVASDGNLLVFVEVKSRRRADPDQGFEAISRSKQKQLIYLARMWLLENHLWEHPARMDVVIVTFGPPGHDLPPELIHVPDAFWAA